MKTYYSGLLISTNCRSLTLITKDHSPPLEQAKHTQAVTPAVQSTSDKKSNQLFRLLKKYRSKIIALLSLFWLWLLARFYITERSRRISRWKLEDIALLKIIKTNALRLWNNHRPNKKLIRLEDWKQGT